MGVNIAKLLPKKEIELTYISGRVIAIDALNWIYQFLSIIRGPDGTPLKDSKGRITSHLSGLLYRNLRLLEHGIKPVYVFDGKPPEFKEKTTQERRERKEEAEKKWEEAKKAGDLEAARTYAQATSRFTPEMKESSKELLEYMGIPVIQAPSEGEAQCAFMCESGLVYAAASQDADSLLFGCPTLIRNLSISGRKKVPKKLIYMEVKPEIIEMNEVLKELKITRDQLIILSLLIGTDYNPGIHGIGPKTALKLVKEHKTLEKTIKAAEQKNPWEGPEPEKILEFFKNPPAKDVKKEEITPGEINKEKILKLMVDEFEFSHERISSALNRGAQKKNQGLGKWIKNG